MMYRCVHVHVTVYSRMCTLSFYIYVSHIRYVIFSSLILCDTSSLSSHSSHSQPTLPSVAYKNIAGDSYLFNMVSNVSQM